MITTRTFLRDEVVVGTCATHARKLVRLLSDSFTPTNTNN